MEENSLRMGGGIGAGGIGAVSGRDWSRGLLGETLGLPRLEEIP